MGNEEKKESWLQPGMTVKKAAIIYIGAALVLAAGTASSQSISQIQTQILTQYNGMEYFAMLSCLATMGMVIMMPVSGKFTDMFGTKLMLWIGTILFAVGSFVTSKAPSLLTFLIFRSIIPFGQACTMVVAYTALGGVFKGKGRNVFYGILSGILAFGMFIGGTLSGYLADINQIWIAIFYPGALLLIGAIMISTQIVNHKREGKKYIDVPGIILLAITVIGLIYMTTFGSVAGWTSPIIICSIIAFVAGLILFIIVERKSPEPIVAIHIFRNPIVTVVCLITVFSVFYSRPQQVYIPQLLQSVVGVSAATSGTVLLSRTITSIIFPTIVAAYAAKNIENRLWKVLFVCGFSITLAFALVVGTGAGTGLAIFFVSYALMGIAEACKGAVITPFLQNTVDKKDLGAATSLNSFFGTAGSQIASCIIGLYYNAAVPDASNLDQLTHGIHGIFWITIASGVIIMLLAIFFVRTEQKKAAARKAAA